MRKMRILPLLIVFALCAGCSMAKKSEGYKMSMKLVETDPRAQALIGEVLGSGSVSSFNISSDAGGGSAEFTIKVKGSMQNGTLVSKLTKSGGKWQFEKAELTAKDGTVIDLAKKGATAGMTVKDAYFAKEKWGTRVEDPTFNKGEMVYYHVIATGLQKSPGGKYNFAADLKVLKPDNSIYLQKDNLIVGQQELPEDELPLVFNITMGDDANTGNYGVSVLVKDNEAGKQVSSAKKYQYVK